MEARYSVRGGERENKVKRREVSKEKRGKR